MSTYDEIYSTLLKLCQKEGLRLVEKPSCRTMVF